MVDFDFLRDIDFINEMSNSYPSVTHLFKAHVYKYSLKIEDDAVFQSKLIWFEPERKRRSSELVMNASVSQFIESDLFLRLSEPHKKYELKQKQTQKVILL